MSLTSRLLGKRDPRVGPDPVVDPMVPVTNQPLLDASTNLPVSYIRCRDVLHLLGRKH